ncbi:MAG TPA: FKBP-type peptidyl-prolyl cis-trans isomerase [Thermodesulfovibrionales bacterium]|nr:FKBP-type peptidyl-prolyl cis-trans isomerase [Thermodesulfovibrionales bacterium]
MRSVWMAVLAILVMAGSVIAEEPIALKSQKDKISYIIGLDIGNNLKRQGAEIDPDTLLRGMKDALSGSKPLLSEDEIREVTTAFRQEMAQKQAEVTKKLAEKNKSEGEAFLGENKKKEGVKILPSGLQYKVITEGSGRSPKESDTVTVNYKGTFVDGTEFDSSYKRGEPATFPVNGVIKGWTEALPLMKEGAKWQLFIPSSLAYGEAGAGNAIGPNATLIFEVELISIK